MSINRRNIIKLGALSIATTALLANSDKKESSTQTTNQRKSNVGMGTPAPLPPAKGPRIVVVGGGWSGLTVAKYAKKNAPNSDVILVEQRAEFISCPISNLYIVDMVDLEFLTHDYFQAARENNYIYFQATAVGIDKTNRVIQTSNGDIEYDYLVLAPGIDYDYSSWGLDALTEQRLRTEYPAAFIPGSEHLSLKSKLHNFKSGNFIMTVPGGNYRCLPGPYERACLIADFFKKRKLNAKLIILDENIDITIKREGFHSAFKELYKDYIEYHPESKINSIDLDKKTVIVGEFDDVYKFEDAAFYPRVRGAKLLEVFGVAKDSEYNKMEGNIDPFTYEVIGEKNIFVSGDARPMPYSKSGNTANSEGQYLGKLIAQRTKKTLAIKWKSPVTVCYSLVSSKPKQNAISIKSEYKFDGKKMSGYTNVALSQDWKGKSGSDSTKVVKGWARGMYMDMFNA